MVDMYCLGEWVIGVYYIMQDIIILKNIGNFILTYTKERAIMVKMKKQKR